MPELDGNLSPAPLVALIGPSGPLSMAELDHYRTVGPNNSLDEWNPKKISHRHHRVCQLAALGEPQNKIAEIVGYSQMQVSQILTSETGQDLVASYQKSLQDRDAAFQMRLSSVRDFAVEKVQEDLEKNLIHGKDLNTLVLGLLDRTGFGPGRTIDINNVHSVDPETKAALEAYNAQQARIIDDPIDLGVSQAELEEGNRGPDLDRVITEASQKTDAEGNDPSAESGDSSGKQDRKVSKKVERFLTLSLPAGPMD